MANENRRTKIALFLVMLMVLTPLASAASVTDFSSGTSEADILLNDASVYSNIVDGSIDLPVGESITSATMAINSDPAAHGSHVRVDVDTIPRVWNPAWNGQTTKFSSIQDFEIEDGSVSTPVSLKAEGILTDFESESGGFFDVTDQPLYSGNTWEHGPIFGGSTPSSCASGEECWGTALYDTDYTDDNSDTQGKNAFKQSLLSPVLDVDPVDVKDPSVYFDSFHQLMTLSSGIVNPTYRYVDCAYVEVRSSSTSTFGDESFTHIGIDIQNSSLSYNSGYTQVGYANENNKIDGRCNGVDRNDFALGGTSITPNNPSGWESIKIDLTDYVGQYVQLRFVMEYNKVQPPIGFSVDNNTMPGWYIDNFRFGGKLAQSGSMTVLNMLPNVDGGENHPNGYGLLTIEAQTTSTAVLSVDIVDSLTGQLVIDNNGMAMSGLVGMIHESCGTSTRRNTLQSTSNSTLIQVQTDFQPQCFMAFRLGLG